MIKTIYLLEDDDDLGNVIKKILIGQGFHVEVFNRLLLLRLSIQSKLPDLLIIDILLPDGNGHDVCKEFKSNNATRHIPIVVMSGLPVSSFGNYAQEYVSKPFEIEEFITKVKRQII
jgi:two-component system phosphate regulon response regulator PhoB